MRVLFVDDDAKVLRGIERMLDSADVDWEMEFTDNCANALELMAAKPIDAVISDMKMPAMDGQKLLQEVSERFPDAIRIILSGQADKESVYRAVNPMHQYLSKPCDADTLTTTLYRANELRQILNSENLRTLVTKVKNLPSVPSVYTKLMDMMSSEDYGLADIAEVVAQDPAMTAKILQLANSAAFGCSKKLSTPAHAVSFLGTQNIQALALSVGVFQQSESTNIGNFSMDALLRHSVDTASAAARIAKAEEWSTEMINEVFTAGVLHDVGKLVLISGATDEFQSAIQIANSQNRPLHEVEMEIFNTDHASVGAYLLSLWGLPQSITEMVGMHHHPYNYSSEFNPAFALYVANELTHRPDNPSEQFLLRLEECGVADKLDEWKSICILEEAVHE